MNLSKRTVALALGIVVSFSMVAQSALRKANKEYELSDFANAVKSYKEVLDRNASHLEANSKIADCYRHLNQLEAATAHYETAVAQEGVNNMYVFQYGLTLQELGRYEPAQKVFEKLAENSPDFRTRARHFAESCSYARNFEEPSLYKVSNEFANTASADFGVALFKEERVVFASGRSDIAVRNNRNASSGPAPGANRLFISQRDKNGFLETPVSLHSGFGADVNEGPIAYSADSKWVAITKNSFANGVRQIPSSGQEMTLYLAQADENGSWTNSVPFPHNGIGFSTGYPAFSQDGNALYFASDRPGGFGGFDIYVSYRTGNSWSAPENLGTALNSLGNEITPFHDGSSLYFASDYHRGFGGFDIFRAEENNRRWATVFHGGSRLNSSADDFGFVFDPLRNIGYFVSNRAGGKGNEDIYRAVKETENVVIKVLDAVNGQPLAAATIDFGNCGEGSFQTNVGGVFNFQMMDNLNCALVVSKTGYISKSVPITSLGLRQNRTIEIKLSNESLAYRGRIINGASGFALENVKVIATSPKTADAIETMAGPDGYYLISLQPGSTFSLRFSKAGFQDLAINFPTSTNDSKSIQTVGLFPVGVAARPIESDFTSPSTTSPLPATSTVDQGFAVQIAALNGTNVDLALYQSKIGDSGKVYALEEGGKTKIRVGVFSDRKDAERVQQSLRGNGFSGAFIVSEKGNQTTAGPSTAAKKIDAASTSANEPGFMVRLATYSDLKYFDADKIEGIGQIKKVSKGKWTIVLLSGFGSKTAALDAMQKAKGRGFPDSFVVVQEGGVLKRVN